MNKIKEKLKKYWPIYLALYISGIIIGGGLNPFVWHIFVRVMFGILFLGITIFAFADQ